MQGSHEFIHIVRRPDGPTVADVKIPPSSLRFGANEKGRSNHLRNIEVSFSSLVLADQSPGRSVRSHKMLFLSGYTLLLMLFSKPVNPIKSSIIILLIPSIEYILKSPIIAIYLYKIQVAYLQILTYLPPFLPQY